MNFRVHNYVSIEICIWKNVIIFFQLWRPIHIINGIYWRFISTSAPKGIQNQCRQFLWRERGFVQWPIWDESSWIEGRFEQGEKDKLTDWVMIFTHLDNQKKESSLSFELVELNVKRVEIRFIIQCNNLSVLARDVVFHVLCCNFFYMCMFLWLWTTANWKFFCWLIMFCLRQIKKTINESFFSFVDWNKGFGESMTSFMCHVLMYVSIAAVVEYYLSKSKHAVYY